MNDDTAKNVLLGINFGFGFLFLLFPRLSMRLFGIDPDGGGAYATRYLGGRLVLLGALLSGENGRRVLVEHWPVLAATDATANVLAAASGEVPKRAVVMGAATSATAIALFAGMDE
jgi:hypothetical protein